MRQPSGSAAVVAALVCLIARAGAVAAADPPPNLLSNPGAETLLPAAQFTAAVPLGYFLTNHFVELADTAPEGWGLFASADTKIKWGATDQEAHSGKISCFLTLLDRLQKKDTDELFERILLGPSNGYAGDKALPVIPRAMYEYSFWVKGDAPKITVQIFTWNTDDGDRAGMKVAYADHTNEPIGPEWKQITGTFMPAADARRMAVSVRMVSAAVGQSIYVDDAVVAVKSAPPPARPPLTAAQLTAVSESFLGTRALVIRPDIAWARDYDTTARAELVRRGMEVVYGEADLLTHAKSLAQFDLVVTDCRRKFTPEQVAGARAYVAAGGALYGSYGGPMDCPELLAVYGAKNAKGENVNALTLLEGPLSAGLGACTLQFPLWVGDGQWGDDKRNKQVVCFEPTTGAPVAKDAAGNCLGVFNELEKGRTALLGFGPDNFKFFTEDRPTADTLLGNTLTWLMPHGPRPHAFSNTVEVRLPRRARLLSAAVNGRVIAKPEQQPGGSLRRVLLPVGAIKPGATATIIIKTEPLQVARNIETWICGGGYWGAFLSPSEGADYLQRIGATVAQPFVRWCGGADFFRPALPLPGEQVEGRATPENYLRDYIAECHKRGIQVVPGLKIDWERYGKINETAPPWVAQDGKVDPKKVCPLDPGVQQHNVDVIACLLDQYPQMDALILDDNFEFQVRPCACDPCKAKFRAYCQTNRKDEASAEVLAEFWKAEVRAFVAKVRVACAARGKPLGGWRELVMDELSQQVLDFHGAMGYGFPPSTAHLTVPLLPADKGYVKMLWGMDRRPEDIASETVEAIRAGCPAVGFWLFFSKLAGDTANWGCGTKDPKPGTCTVAPGTFDAVAAAFARVEQDWLDYYRDSILGGDVRFALVSAQVKTDSLTVTIKNTGQRVTKRNQGPVDLGPLAAPAR